MTFLNPVNIIRIRSQIRDSRYDPISMLKLRYICQYSSQMYSVLSLFSKVYFKSLLLKILFLTNFPKFSKSPRQTSPSGISRIKPMNSLLADFNRCILQAAKLGYWLSHRQHQARLAPLPSKCAPKIYVPIYNLMQHVYI